MAYGHRFATCDAAELHDLMNAEKQIVAELPIMASRATSVRLRRAFEDHHAETKVQIERLRLLLEQLNEPPRGVPERRYRGA